MGTDTRIGQRFLFPGIGYGGSCFPKDVQALAKSGAEHGYKFEILDSVLDVNNKQKLSLIRKLKSYYAGNLSGKTFALWGLAFKPDTDDIREAPALYMIEELLKEGAKVRAYDPEAMENVKRLYGDKIEFCENLYDTTKDADALLIATEWSVFRNPDFNKLASNLKEKVIFDGRNLFETSKLKQLGYHYESIGREKITK